MFDVLVKKETQDFCVDWLKNNTMGMRRDDNGSKNEQTTGLISEVVAKKIFGIPVSVSQEPDDGYDFMWRGVRIEQSVMFFCLQALIKPIWSLLYVDGFQN